MPNPFRMLGIASKANKGEEVTGAFACQEPECYITVTVATYLEEQQILTWKCSKDHISKIEGFYLD